LCGNEAVESEAAMEAKRVEVGQHVVFVDQDRKWHESILVGVWGEPSLHTVLHEGVERMHYPCVNLVHVSADGSKTDQYGRQIERDGSSVPHYLDSTAPGYCWLHPDEAEEAREHFSKCERGVKI